MTDKGLTLLINSYVNIRTNGLKLYVSKNKDDSELGSQLLKYSNQMEQLFPNNIKKDLH